MKKIMMITASLVVGLSANAALYSQDFSTDPGLVEADIDWPDHVKYSGVSYASTDDPLLFTNSTYAAAGTYFMGDFGNVTTDGGSLDLTGHTAPAGRTIVSGVTIDTSGWTAGSHTISFAVASFTNPNAVDGDFANFSLFEGSGVSGGAANNVTYSFDRNFNKPLPSFTTAGTAAAPNQIG